MKIRIFTKKKISVLRIFSNARARGGGGSISQVFMKIIYEIFSLVCHCQDFHQRPNFQLCKKKKKKKDSGRGWRVLSLLIFRQGSILQRIVASYARVPCTCILMYKYETC